MADNNVGIAFPNIFLHWRIFIIVQRFIKLFTILFPKLVYDEEDVKRGRKALPRRKGKLRSTVVSGVGVGADTSDRNRNGAFLGIVLRAAVFIWSAAGIRDRGGGVSRPFTPESMGHFHSF